MLLLKTADSYSACSGTHPSARGLKRSRLGNAPLAMGVPDTWLRIPLLKPAQREIQERGRRLVLLTSSAEGMVIYH